MIVEIVRLEGARASVTERQGSEPQYVDDTRLSDVVLTGSVNVGWRSAPTSMCEWKFSILNSLTYIVSGVGSSAPRCATQVIGHLEHT